MNEMRSIMVPIVVSKFSIKFDCNMLCFNLPTNQVKQKSFEEELTKEERIAFASHVALEIM